MNKSDLINYVFINTTLSKKDCEIAVNALFETMMEKLIEGESIKIAGFGSFEVRQRKGKNMYNPTTKENIPIPSQKSIKFKPSKLAKGKVNC